MGSLKKRDELSDEKMSKKYSRGPTPEARLNELSSLVERISDLGGSISPDLKSAIDDLQATVDRHRKASHPTYNLSPHHEVGSQVFISNNAYVCTCFPPCEEGFCETCSAHEEGSSFSKARARWSFFGSVPARVIDHAPKVLKHYEEGSDYMIRVLPQGSSRPVWCNAPSEVRPVHVAKRVVRSAAQNIEKIKEPLGSLSETILDTIDTRLDRAQEAVSQVTRILSIFDDADVDDDSYLDDLDLEIPEKREILETLIDELQSAYDKELT